MPGLSQDTVTLPSVKMDTRDASLCPIRLECSPSMGRWEGLKHGPLSPLLEAEMRGGGNVPLTQQHTSLLTVESFA